MTILPANILAIDPGPESSAWLLWNGSIVRHGFFANNELFTHLRNGFGIEGATIAIEMIASYGMAVGKEVFETCTVIGRIEEILKGNTVRRVFRKDIKIHLCGSMKAKDGNIRQALIDRIGPQGTKKAPGPTYGISKHAWAALAVAVYAADTLKAVDMEALK